MNTPRISVVVPFYNNADVLGDCLASIAAQTFRELEVIMVDDGSAGGGAMIAAQWAAADPRFTLVQVPNGGPGKARNIGVERARGEFLAFVDGDDMLPPHAYETLLHALESSGGAAGTAEVRGEIPLDALPAGQGGTARWDLYLRPAERGWARSGGGRGARGRGKQSAGAGQAERGRAPSGGGRRAGAGLAEQGRIRVTFPRRCARRGTAATAGRSRWSGPATGPSSWPSASRFR